jgi:branched-chain amino acid transport system substrate-binding protein
MGPKFLFQRRIKAMKKSLLVTVISGIIVGLGCLGISLAMAGDPGVTKTTIKIGSNMILTGSAAYWGQGSDKGARAYYTYINEMGGIHGRKIEFINSDSQFKPAQAVAAIKKLIEKDEIFILMGMQSSVCILAAEKVFGEAGVPLIAPITMHRQLVDPPRKYLFVVFTEYWDQAQYMVDYMAKEARWKNLKFAVIYQDDDFGKEGLAGLEDGVKKYPSMQVVAKESFAPGAKDFSSQVLKCKQSGAQGLFLSCVTAQAAMMIKEAEKIGWKPLFMVHSATADDKLIELAGPATEGALGVTNVVIPSSEKDSPPVKKATEIIHKYYPDQAIDVPTIDGIAMAMITVEGLKKAGPDLTRVKLIEALENMKNFETGLVPPVTFGPNNRQGCRGALLYQIQGGKFVRLK